MNALTTAQPVRRSFSEGGLAEAAQLDKAIQTNLRGLGYGG
jgi:hypothetical protein